MSLDTDKDCNTATMGLWSIHSQHKRSVTSPLWFENFWRHSVDVGLSTRTFPFGSPVISKPSLRLCEKVTSSPSPT